VSPAPGARVLVVDDEPAITRALRTLLTRYDFQVKVAETGGEALAQFVDFRPDLILLDLGLPDMNGLEVLRRVREHHSVPVVILSVRGAERDKVTALEMGADDYLTKRRYVTVDDKEVHLSPTEYELLKAFVAHPDKVLTDRMLLQLVWGPQYGDEAHYLHVYVARLRKKIEADPQNPSYLITEPGVGYRLLVKEP